MIINNIDCTKIFLSNIQLEEDYESVTVVLDINSELKIEKTYESPIISDEITITEDTITLEDKFFSEQDLLDGIYHIKIITKKGDNYTVIKNCAFIDCNLKCKISYFTEKSLKKSSQLHIKEEAVVFNMLYYSLIEGSNCGCNCEELQNIYDKLLKELNILITDECGC